MANLLTDPDVIADRESGAAPSNVRDTRTGLTHDAARRGLVHGSISEFDSDNEFESDNEAEIYYSSAVHGISPESQVMMRGAIPDGLYRAMCGHVQRDHSSIHQPVIELAFLVLSGTVPGQITRQFRTRLSLADKSSHQVLRWAYCMGVLDRNDMFLPAPSANWRDAIGGQVVVEILTREVDASREKLTTITGMWRATDPAVEDVPKAGCEPEKRMNWEEYE